jgi:hypothetical protein
VGLENEDALAAIDTLDNKLIATIPVGQAPQAVVYVPGAVPEGDGAQGLQALGIAAGVTHLVLVPASAVGRGDLSSPPTSVSLFDQGLVQVVQVSATGLDPKQPFVLALATNPDGTGALEPLASFIANPAGAAVVNAVGPIRQIVKDESTAQRRYLVIAPGAAAAHGPAVQVQAR